MKLGWGLLLLAASAPLWAAVSDAQVASLRGRLTPMGAERAANPAGTIPDWRGGLTAPPACYRPGARYCDPYAGEQPYATITAANAGEWSEQLSPGHLELLLRHPDSYSIRLFASRRSFANPPAIYEASIANAKSARLRGGGETVAEATAGIPFPIPEHGAEPLWNHRLRYRGPGYTRTLGQGTVTPSGELNLIRVREDAQFSYSVSAALKDFVPLRFMVVALEPARIHGYGMLIRETLDPAETARDTWVEWPDGQIARKSRSFGYDSAAMLGEDLRFDDQIDGFLGGFDRYFWRLAGKRELIVPYNAYGLHSGRGSLRELVRTGHLDPAPQRYELHRVWVVEANVRPGAVHRYKRRTFYLDEDSWQILMVDLYDASDRLWRWQETHTVMAYDRAVLMPVFETIHDLQTGRYWFQGHDTDDPEAVESAFEKTHFSPSTLGRLTR